MQPRDYINSFQLYIGLLLIILGLLVARPVIVAPALNHNAPDLKPIFPLLFVTIACGAVSGFHCLVASGTSAKQLDSERDARLVSYGGMLLEGLLSVAVILACVAGLAHTRADWLMRYPSWAEVSKIKLSLFVDGAANMLNALGIPLEFARPFIAVVIISFAMTSLDTATRLLRYNIEEIGGSVKVEFLRNRFVSSLGAVLAIGFFAFAKIKGNPAGLALIHLFGTTNQLLAALALLVVTLYLYRKGAPTLFTAIPMVLMVVITISAMLVKINDFFRDNAWMLLGTGVIILLLAVWLLIEAWLAWQGSVRVETELEKAGSDKESSA